MPIPLHLFGGPLGVGKTTAIRRYVAESDEYVAVIVNDFGETGYDAALIAEKGTADRLRIENVHYVEVFGERGAFDAVSCGQ